MFHLQSKMFYNDKSNVLSCSSDVDYSPYKTMQKWRTTSKVEFIELANILSFSTNQSAIILLLSKSFTFFSLLMKSTSICNHII